MRPPRLRTSIAALALLVGLAGREPSAGAAPPTLDRKAIEALGVRWWKARPKTKFDEWDWKVRLGLLEEAKALGPIPEGSLDEVRDLLWKGVRKHGPSGSGEIPTPYGKATWKQHGAGGRKAGLVIGLHGGGPGAGSADEPAGTWSVPGCLGMYPQGIKLVHDTWNTVHGERFVLTLMEIAKAQHDVDPDRVMTMGFSMGGTGSWFFAGRHPDLLAASCPCAGVLMAEPKSQVMTKEEVKSLQHGFLPNVRNLSMHYFIGLEDKNCMPGTYLYAWDAIEALRRKDPGGYAAIEFATTPGLGHSFPPGEPGKALKWAAGRRRDSYPRKIVWEYVENPFPLPEDDPDRTVGRFVKRDFYWLHCDRPADRSTVTATIADNVVDLTLDQAHAEDFTVLLNARMIDPAKEVVVRADGKELYRGKPVPDVATVLETLDARLDRSLTFDRRVRLAR
jgi:hypothetical protein